MSFFELSVFDLVLSAAVVIVIMFFVFVLLKLNPSAQNDEVHNEKALEESSVTGAALHSRQSQLDPQHIPQQDPPPVSWKSQQDPVLQTPQQLPPKILINTAAIGGSEENLEPAPSPTPIPEVREFLRTTETNSVSKHRSKTSKNYDGKSCSHKFGYLMGLPKNRPIPQECFGCERIVDCLRSKKGR